MKRYITLCRAACLVVLLCASLPAAAQTLSGRLTDEQNQPLPYANVALLSLPDSTFVAGAITDEQGHFTLTSDMQSGLVRISSVGYATVYKEARADMGVIVMQPDARMLQEVVVKSRLPVTRISGDALVTTVQGSVLADAGSAADVLARVPAVIRKDDSFEVFGKGAPLIYINGRKVRSADELEQLNSSDIRQVEVVTNPGARYDASVKSVIRIRTVKRKGDGFGFDVRSTYNYAEKRTTWTSSARSRIAGTPACRIPASARKRRPMHYGNRRTRWTPSRCASAWKPWRDGTMLLGGNIRLVCVTVCWPRRKTAWRRR